jgi:hypothetical protein
VSDTPRTDDVIFRATLGREAVVSSFSRQLELELAEVTRQLAKITRQRNALADALEMVRDADEDCHKDGLPTIPSVARHKIDMALAIMEGGKA